MKTILSVFFAILFLFASNADAQYTTLTAQTAKSFYKASTVEDTSSTLTVGSYPNIFLHTTTTGTDSAVIYQNFDAYLNGLWANNIYRDTVTLGRPAGYTLAATKGQVRYKALRVAGTDLLNGATQIRIRSKHASGAGDSTSATTYTQKLIMRKP
jgi:hypothetical protein